MLHPFGEFPSKEKANEGLVNLGWTASVVTDGFYRNGLTATIIPYYKPLPFEELGRIKTIPSETKDR